MSLDGAEWQGPPVFVSSLGANAPMRFFFDRGPKLFYGCWLFVSVAAVIGRHLYYG